jgi:hypothetical protein
MRLRLSQESKSNRVAKEEIKGWTKSQRKATGYPKPAALWLKYPISSGIDSKLRISGASKKQL